MALFDNFPWTDYHKLNLTWVIKTIKQTVKAFDDLKEETDDAINYMKDNIEATTTEVINQFIEQGLIDVAVNYNADNERLDIIVTEREG